MQVSAIKRMLAVDLGASSGRVILGSYNRTSILTEELHRFPNTPVQADGHLFWNISGLFQEIKQGIKKACAKYSDIHSISIDTWGVDYGLLDANGRLLCAPHHYRDQRVNAIRDELEELLPLKEQFRLTGNQPNPINTVYQLFADFKHNPTLADNTDKILMMPDLLHYLLSGRARAEKTIWSTSGLISAVTGAPSAEILSRLGIPDRLFAERVEAGTILGDLLPELAEELGAGSMKVIVGASHDTAAAVASIPYVRQEGVVFISCGTWSLVGMSTGQPVLSDEAYRLGFTNEGCFGGGVRLLKNITGLWLLQETQRAWAEAGSVISFEEMAALAEANGSASVLINPNDQLFRTQGDMAARIAEYCRDTGQQVPESKGAVIRVILDSLAEAYRVTISELEQLTGSSVTRIFMVGGGIQNKLLCQLTADATGKEILAGPVEASAIGNLIVQLTALGELDFEYASEVVAASEKLAVYRPLAGKSLSEEEGE